MSTQQIREALEGAGIKRAESARLAAAVLDRIERQLAQKGVFNLRGIGKLEVVANRLGNRLRKTPLRPSGVFNRFTNLDSSLANISEQTQKASPGLPVRVRFVVSRELKTKIACATRQGGNA